MLLELLLCELAADRHRPQHPFLLEHLDVQEHGGSSDLEAVVPALPAIGRMSVIIDLPGFLGLLFRPSLTRTLSPNK